MTPTRTVCTPTLSAGCATRKPRLPRSTARSSPPTTMSRISGTPRCCGPGCMRSRGTSAGPGSCRGCGWPRPRRGLRSGRRRVPAPKDAAMAELERTLLAAELASLDWPDTDGLSAAHREVLELSVRHGMESRAIGMMLGKPAAESFELLSQAWHELERSLAATGPAAHLPRALLRPGLAGRGLVGPGDGASPDRWSRTSTPCSRCTVRPAQGARRTAGPVYSPARPGAEGTARESPRRPAGHQPGEGGGEGRDRHPAHALRPLRVPGHGDGAAAVGAPAAPAPYGRADAGGAPPETSRRAAGRPRLLGRRGGGRRQGGHASGTITHPGCRVPGREAAGEHCAPGKWFR